MLSARGSGTPRGSGGGGGDTLKAAGRGLLSARGAGPPAVDRPPVAPALERKALRQGIDTAPNVLVGGKRGEVPSWSCEPDIIGATPRTLEGRDAILSRHRRRTEPGEITKHWALKGVPLPDPGDGYGIKSSKTECVAQNFRSGQRYGVDEYLNARGESIYHSTRCEPLGGSWLRGHTLPTEIEEPNFKGFGEELVRDDIGAKETIFPRNVEPEKAADLERYKQTHGDYEPGETATRKYTWPRAIVENDNFRFGIVQRVDDTDGRSGSGAKSALTMDCEDDRSFPRTRIVNSTSEEYRKVANDHLGTSRNLRQGDLPVPAGHAYGMKSSADMMHAGELIRGFYSVAEQMPDSDLGKCVVPGRRNFATASAFGCSTVRHNKAAPPPDRRSVADSTNYGDDLDAHRLVFPGKFVFQGVCDEDFRVRRPRNELRSVLTGAGYSMEDDSDFDLIWDTAVELYGDHQSFVSLEAFIELFADREANGAVGKRDISSVGARAATRQEAVVADKG